MSQQLRDWAKQALEMLEDNHHLVADNEKHAYVMLHLEVIEKGKALLEQPADWVGLTDEQKLDLISEAKGIGGRIRTDGQLLELLKEHEAKLREKNGGAA
jgi:hypothetical protein